MKAVKGPENSLVRKFRAGMYVCIKMLLICDGNSFLRLILQPLFQLFFLVNHLVDRDELIRDRCYDFENIFAEKNTKIWRFFTQNKAKICNILIITLVFEKNAIFAENCRKSQKIVIITSTPGFRVTQGFGMQRAPLHLP
jgi:hypothetical protein